MGFGIIFVLFGLFLSFFEKMGPAKVGGWWVGRSPLLGKLPGDIFIKRENFTPYKSQKDSTGFIFCFPITTSLLLSFILTLIFWLIRRFTQKSRNLTTGFK